jgi:cation diffusion facilitator family transporter
MASDGTEGYAPRTGGARAPLTARRAADRRALTLAMSLSLSIGLVMFAIKVGAYLLTGSAAILSDAAESVVHVAAVLFAFYSLRYSYKPADADHPYGHAKIGFFSAGFEGAMIILAAVYIIFEAVRKWLTGLELDNLGLGTFLTVLAMIINGALGAYLVWIGRKRKSIILTANGKHVLTDCWTSLGVIAGLCLALVTDWLPWDPIAAIAVATNILFSGIKLIRQSIGGLMDVADPKSHQQIIDLLERETTRRGVRFHHVRHRSLGDTYWVEVHLLFAGSTPLGEAHRLATEIEDAVAAQLEPQGYVTTHLEAIEDHHRVHSAGTH